MTRRKENLITAKTTEESTTSDLSTLKNFDEYYKNNKNVIHEAYYYKKPRISEYNQVSPDMIPKCDFKRLSDNIIEADNNINIGMISNANTIINDKSDSMVYGKLIIYLYRKKWRPFR